MSWFNRKPQRKITKKITGRKRKGVTAERLIFWFRRFGVSIGVLTFCLWLGAWFFLSGTAAATGDWVKNKTLSTSVDMGFGIENVLVDGRVFTDRKVLLSLLGVKKGDPLFGLDLKSAKKKIQNISWVKDVVIERQLPNTLSLKITEREPVGLWQKNKKISVIDSEGVVLTNNVSKEFKDFIIFTGVNVNNKAGSFLELLRSEPSLYQKVEAAQYVSERRWNLTLKTGLLIKLPEESVAFALSQLVDYQKQDGLLDKKIKSLDARMFPRIIVQTFPGDAYTYQANYKLEENAI